MSKLSIKIQGIVLLLAVLQGCASPVEVTRKFWGSSMQSLEDGRTTALTDTLPCDFDECFDAILAMKRLEPSPFDNTIMRDLKKDAPDYYDIFLQDRLKGIIVLMGIKGNVNTTEVGIFLTSVDGATTRLEVVSLSTSAKERAAAILFRELHTKFDKGV